MFKSISKEQFEKLPPHLKTCYTVGNSHPTTKNVVLMEYLLTLGSRPGDTILEPFAGSGTTAVAAKILDRQFIAIERELEYVNIAEARINSTDGEKVEITLTSQPTPTPPQVTATEPVPVEDAATRRARLIDEELSGRKLTPEEVAWLRGQQGG